MYLFEVKKPAESKGEWDLYKKLETIPGDQAFQPLDAGQQRFVALCTQEGISLGQSLGRGVQARGIVGQAIAQACSAACTRPEQSIPARLLPPHR